MADTPKRAFGLLAEFASTHALFSACERIRDAGYTVWDAHSPFPVHGLERAMGLKRSPLPWFVLAMALAGMGGALALQSWIHVVDYPLVISGKPFFSWQAFVIVMFEVTILFGALGAVLGMLHLNRIPRHHHPLFRSTRFERVTDDTFFVSIEAADPKYDATATKVLLESLGATCVETVEE